MPTRIIYHVFRNQASSSASKIVMISQILNRGRQMIRAIEVANAALNVVCLVLFGVCIVVSIAVFCIAILGG